MKRFFPDLQEKKKEKGRRKTSPDETGKDHHLWQSLANQIKPLEGRKQLAPRPLPPSPRQIDVAPRPFAPPPPRGNQQRLPTLQQTKHASTTAGIDTNTEIKFRAGKMEISARLDLHGMTQDEAHHATARLVTRAYNTNQRCLLVITGKGSITEGRGVLRKALPLWLDAPDLRPMILAIAPAKQEHGGDGAIYILIKRKR